MNQSNWQRKLYRKLDELLCESPILLVKSVYKYLKS